MNNILTKDNWEIIIRGNTVKSLAVITTNNEKICSGISPKKKDIAECITLLPRLINFIEFVKSKDLTGDDSIDEIIISARNIWDKIEENAEV